jgi:hypothetical protein
MRIPCLRTLLFALAFVTISTASLAQVSVGISVGFGPPPLPVYEQPICPGDGYIWTPGYWAWDPEIDDYYWVPGTWILAPEVGFLWTPPWWGWEGGRFFFHEGYWGPHIGFYGGVVYGFGYFGEGFEGGRWDGDHFFYNRSVTNINVVNVHNVYNQTVINNNVTINRVSYNGGPGGISARPTPQQEAAGRERHVEPVRSQTEHMQMARGNPELRATANHGKPSIAATGKPGEFHGGSVVHAREAGGEYHPPANRAAAAHGNGNEPRGNEAHGGGNAGRTFSHPNELPPMERHAPANTGNAKLDQKYQQQQEKLFNKQNQERQKLQQQQEREHQQAQQRNYNQQRQQQMEQHHQQQTQQMQERHQQQQQHLQERQQPPPQRHK